MATVRQTIPADAPPGFPPSTEQAAGSASVLAAGGGAASDYKPIAQEKIDEPFEALLQQVHANLPTEDVSLIRKAWEFCVQHHAGQMRASGEPYIIHPLEVAEVLAEMKMDATAIAAGLLHDAVS